MLTLEQIPEPVWRRVQEFTGRTDEHFCKCLAAEVVAAWPGVRMIVDIDTGNDIALRLPLPQETSDSDWGKPVGKEEW